MKEVAVYELKTRLSELLVQVESGEPILITRRGVPVARLVAAPASRHDNEQDRRKRIADALAALKRQRKSHLLGGSLRDAIDEGRD